METVEVVIKIPKVIYDDLSNKEMLDEFIKSEVHFYDFEIGKAIQNGTELPKGHGKLKDVNEIERIWKKGNYVRSALLFAPTIIEADEEEDNADSN